MLPEQPATVVTTGKTLALVLSLLICSHRVFAEDPNDIYSELPLPSTGNVQPSSVQHNGPRLSDLLHLKESVSEILSRTPETDTKESHSEETFGAPGFAKRIFCNGFTGCGGRFRDRRRLVRPAAEFGKRLPILSKRPFCNAYGCYNSGRKRSSQTPLDNRNEAPQKEITFVDSWPGVRQKKLFCNGYGGCQNMGKRLAILTGDVAKEVSDGHQLSGSSLTTGLGRAGGKKRFFTYDYDSAMDSLVDNMGR